MDNNFKTNSVKVSRRVWADGGGRDTMDFMMMQKPTWSDSGFHSLINEMLYDGFEADASFNAATRTFSVTSGKQTSVATGQVG